MPHVGLPAKRGPEEYLAPVKAKKAINGVATTKAGPLLRSSIQVRRANLIDVRPRLAMIGVSGEGSTAYGEKIYRIADTQFGYVIAEVATRTLCPEGYAYDAGENNPDFAGIHLTDTEEWRLDEH